MAGVGPPASLPRLFMRLAESRTVHMLYSMKYLTQLWPRAIITLEGELGHDETAHDRFGA